MAKTDYRTGFAWVFLSAGLGGVYWIVASPGIEEARLTVLAVMTAICFSMSAFYFGWFKPPAAIGEIGRLPRAVLILGLIWGPISYITYRYWPQTFAVTIEWGQTSYDDEKNRQLGWVEQNSDIAPIRALILVRVKNLQPISAMIGMYKVELETDDGWQQIAAFDMRTHFMLIGSQENGGHFNFADGAFFDREIDNKNYEPGAVARGWIAGTCLPPKEVVHPHKYRITVRDAAGHEFISPMIEAIGPTPESIGTRFKIGPILDIKHYRFADETCPPKVKP